MTRVSDRYTPRQLRQAAEEIAHDRYPDQAGRAPSSAFTNGESWTEVRMTGGNVFVTREQAGQHIRKSPAMTDAQALDSIATILRHPDWRPAMLDDIAAIVDETGRDVNGDGSPTWDSH